MKTLGLIGGVGPESTIEYYRLIIAAYRETGSPAAYPPIIINSINLQQYLVWINANEMESFTERFVVEIERLARAGADFAALASNTPHIVFDELQRRSSLPLISIVEAACERVKELGLKKIALFGTGSRCRGSSIRKSSRAAGIELIVPDETEQNYIHEKYMGELLNDQFLPETRERMLTIADDLKRERASKV
jgi:aspartate racemase